MVIIIVCSLHNIFKFIIGNKVNRLMSPNETIFEFGCNNIGSESKLNNYIVWSILLVFMTFDIELLYILVSSYSVTYFFTSYGAISLVIVLIQIISTLFELSSTVLFLYKA